MNRWDWFFRGVLRRNGKIRFAPTLSRNQTCTRKEAVYATQWESDFLAHIASFIMANVDRAYNQVRNELAEVGLLADGVYLDAVELCISHEKSGDGEVGYVFERVGHYAKRGYKPGVIYLPRDLPHKRYQPGHTLTDTIRHEYAHAWYYLDQGFFRQDWFARTFGAAYSNCAPTPYQSWRKQLKKEGDFNKSKARSSNSEALQRHFSNRMLMHFVSEYATTNASEDFAETFMFYLKYRRSLDRFINRPGVYQKIRMVERAVCMAARRTRQFNCRNIRVRSA
jgi:Putative zinc-binding metallo-peptidase